MSASQKQKINKHIFFSWAIFSILYFISAYSKPFHVDEFYSWVYAEKCAFLEIFFLKDFGIGHPPLYHILQKSVQSVFTHHHFLHVRLINYFVGSLFVVIFMKFLMRHKFIPLFCYSACISATILDVFIFSRMWGLVCLSSLLLFIIGEQYYKKHETKYFVLLFCVSIFGIISDYNFIIMFPYFLIILFNRNKFFQKYFPLLIISLLILWAFARFVNVYIMNDGTIANYSLAIFHDVKMTINNLLQVVFGFWFFETYLCAVIVFTILITFKLRESFIPLRSKYRIIEVIKNVYYAIIKTIKNIFNLKTDVSRAVITICGALLIIASINPVFWRNLIDKRFMLLLYPFLIFIIHMNFNKRALYIISFILIFSSLIYISSNRIASYYPPSFTNNYSPLLYHDEMCYSTQYLKSSKDHLKTPVLFDFSKFRMFCRVCKMGSKDFNFNNYDKLWLIGRDDFKKDNYIPVDYKLTNRMFLQSSLDSMLFKYLTPILSRRFALYEFQKKEKHKF